MAERSKGMSALWGGVALLAWAAAACSSVFSSDGDCRESRTCPPVAAEAGAAGAGEAGEGGEGGEGTTLGGASAGAGGAGAASGDACEADADCDDAEAANGVEWCSANGACRDGDPPPVVVEVTPADGDVDVAPNATIEILFSEELAEATVTDGAVQLWRGDVPVEADVSYEPGNIVKLSPKKLLALLGEYQVVVSTDVTDLGGGALLEEHRSAFRVTEGMWRTSLASDGTGSGLADGIVLNDEGRATVAWNGPHWRHLDLGVPVVGSVETSQPEGGSVLLASMPGGDPLLMWSTARYWALGPSKDAPEDLRSEAGWRYHTRARVSPGGVATLFRQQDVGSTAFLYTKDGWLRVPGDPKGRPVSHVLSTTLTMLSPPAVAFDEEDNGVAFWRASNESGQQHIYMSSYTPTTKTWTAAAPLSGSQSLGPAHSGRGAAPAAAASPDGFTVVLWIDQPTTDGPCVLWSKALSSIQAPVRLTDPAAVAVSCNHDAPALVFDGDTFVAAFTATESDQFATYTMRWDTASQQWGQYEKRQAQGEPAATAKMPRLATDGAGSSFLLWSTGDGTYQLHYQRYASGAWTSSAQVPNSLFQDEFFVAGHDSEPAPALPLAMNRAGMVAVAWEERAGRTNEFTKLHFASLQ